MEATHLVFGFGIGICIGFVICVGGFLSVRRTQTMIDRNRRERRNRREQPWWNN